MQMFAQEKVLNVGIRFVIANVGYGEKVCIG